MEVEEVRYIVLQKLRECEAAVAPTPAVPGTSPTTTAAGASPSTQTTTAVPALPPGFSTFEPLVALESSAQGSATIAAIIAVCSMALVAIV